MCTDVQRLEESVAGAEPLVGVPEMARRLGVSKRSVYRLVERGLVPSYRAGRKIVFSPREVLEALRTTPWER